MKDLEVFLHPASIENKPDYVVMVVLFFVR